MVKSDIFCRSLTSFFSPSNVVKKVDDGVVKPGQYRFNY